MSARHSGQDFLQAIHDPHEKLDHLRQILGAGSAAYYLCLGGTATSDIDGVSMAGATPEMRRLTPSLDADILVAGKARPNESIPVSPLGIVSPVVIVRACLRLLNVRPFVVDCGTFRSPLAPDMVAGDQPAECVTTGRALSESVVRSLFNLGLQLGRELNGFNYVMLAECVPGGTTTAAALLHAFGIDASSLVASSVRVPDVDNRRRLIERGLTEAGLSREAAFADPLKAVCAVGDPMQPFVAGMALGAAERMPVILSGGSQMLAVYFLANLLASTLNCPTNCHNLYVITTKWVAFDPTSDAQRLSHLVAAQLYASSADFNASRHAGLRAYEEGNVKEGMGAGTVMAAAQAVAQLDNAALLQAIDDSFEEVVLGKSLLLS